MNKQTVYLGGPITGLTYKEATEWRQLVYDSVSANFEIRDPMRKKQCLAISTTPINAIDNSRIETSTDFIMMRDYEDVKKADILFVNLLNAGKASIGTIAEIAWAYQVRKPVIVVMEQGNPHWHPFIIGMASILVHTLSEGINVLNQLAQD